MAKPAASRKGRKKAAASRPAVRGGKSGPGKSAKRAPGAAVRKAPRKSATEKAADEFVRGVLARGEAAKAGRRGKLPPGATHEIVGEAQAGLPKLRRRRFSLA